MSFQKRTILDTQEAIYSNRITGQVVPILSGRLDKVSVYIQPSFYSPDTNLDLFVDIYEVDGSDIPFGQPIISRSRSVSEISGNGYFNLPVEAIVPVKVAIVLRLNGGDRNNYIGTKYIDNIDASDEPMLVSEDNGMTWVKYVTKKITYVAYSSIQAVGNTSNTQYGYSPITYQSENLNEQSATIQAAKSESKIDKIAYDFQKQDLEGTIVQGDTVVINFKDIIVTLIVDQSGSMTWNDRSGVRFDFLKSYIDDLESILPPGTTAYYNIIKFNGRKIGRMRLILQEDATSPSVIAGVRIVRKAGSIPVSTPTDGVVIYEGLSESLIDKNLSTGTDYQYGAFSYNMSGVFSSPKHSFSTPIYAPCPPVGVTSFLAKEEVVPNIIISGPYSGSWDIGQRRVVISWAHPQSEDTSLLYNRIILVRRTDRFPENEKDGDMLLDADDTSMSFNGPYIDFNNPYAVAGQTYYYSIFTKKYTGISCSIENSRSSEVYISECDRFWLRCEPPADDPSNYGFYTSIPSIPNNITVFSGDSQIKIYWDSGSVDTKRYEIWFNKEKNIEFKKNENGNLYPDGELIYNGQEPTFTHRDLKNGEPNFYMILAYNFVGTQSASVKFEVKAIQETTTTIEPSCPDNFSAEPYNSISNRVTWSLPITDTHSYEGYFGDYIKSICSVSFEDEIATIYSGKLKFNEHSRKIVNIVDGYEVEIYESTSTPIPSTVTVNGETIDTSTLVSPQKGMSFAEQESGSTTIISSIFSSNPIISVQNKMQSIEISFDGSLEIINRSTAELITGIATGEGTIKLSHPLTLSIENDPVQYVNIMNWDSTCDTNKSPTMTIMQETGVYVKTGDPFYVTVKASFKGAAIDKEVQVSFRIIDKETKEPSTVCTLSGQDSNGVSVFKISLETDEVLDRSDQPTGITEQVSKISFKIPPQDIPGNYILESSISYLGYEKIARLEMKFAASLNIDMDLSPFEANGMNTAEQKTFVYFGNPLSQNKIPVEDGTIVEWSIRPLDTVSQINFKKRPFYSLSGIHGTGIHSSTKAGVAKEVFFGPGLDIGVVSDDPTVQQQTDLKREISSCITQGELYEVKATAKVSGLVAIGYGTIYLTSQMEPIDSKQLTRIFLRKVDGFNTDTIYSDGTSESEWEVVAKPESDGDVSDMFSGAYFREKITSLGGLVPSLEDGKIITLNASLFSGDPEGQRIMISTNLTGTNGRAGYAKARIENGVARFKVRLNSIVSGIVKQTPLKGGNLIYGSIDMIAWRQSPLIYSLSAYTILESNGLQVTFYGGGADVYYHTPPCYLSFAEPLNLHTNNSGGE